MAAAGFAQGDGSGTDNPDLLRGSVGVACTPGTLCHFPPFDPTVRPVTLAPSYTVAPSATAIVPDMALSPARGLESQTPETATPLAATAPIIVPDEDMPRPFKAEYGVTLRGTYVTSEGRDRFEMLAIPEATLTRAAAASEFSLAAQAAFVAPSSDQPRLSDASLNASALHRLSPSAGLSFDASLDYSRDDANGFTIDDANVAQAPDRVGVSVDTAYAHRFGRLDVLASAGLSQQWVGETVFDDGTSEGNRAEEVFAYGGSLRLGYEVTPIVGAFVSGSVDREDFAATDPDLGAARSGVVYALRTGVTGHWSDRMRLEASIGSAWRTYDAVTLDDSQGWLYGLAAVYSPTATTQLRADFETRLDAGRGSSAAREVYDLTLVASHRINPWVALRASALAGWDVPVDGSAGAERYGAGLGADVLIGPRTSAAFDYSYGWRDDQEADPVVRDEHRVSGGLTLRY